jgi:putative NADH-flavin reductase
MEQINKIAVLGGTGKSGKYLIKQLLDQGFYFKILVRNPERFQIQHSSVEVLVGDVSDYGAIHTLVDGCDAVISNLGLGIPPSEPTIFSLATQHIIQAMNECSVGRYILTTGLNVDTPSDKKGDRTKSATEWMYQNYPVSTADRQKEYSMLTVSNVDWTLVRLPLIKQTDARGKVSISLEDCPGDYISTTDLAHFLIEQLSDNTYSRKAPFIANI